MPTARRPDFQTILSALPGNPERFQSCPIAGEYHIELQNGSLDGRPQPDGSILLSFEGMDETTEVYVAGTARVEDDRLVFTLMYHQGDDYNYEGRRRS